MKRFDYNKVYFKSIGIRTSFFCGIEKLNSRFVSYNKRMHFWPFLFYKTDAMNIEDLTFSWLYFEEIFLNIHFNRTIQTSILSHGFFLLQAWNLYSDAKTGSLWVRSVTLNPVTSIYFTICFFSFKYYYGLWYWSAIDRQD